jgi:surface protein
MKKNHLLLRLVVLMAAVMCALGANAAEAYACYTPSTTTLTFYYDNLRSSRTDVTYDLNTGYNAPDWETDGTNAVVTKVVFNSSFANARPMTTARWFNDMENLQSITGLSYLNTSEVTNMFDMFSGCRKLTTLDVSHFNTSKVTDMYCMFNSCSNLTSLDLSHFNTPNLVRMNEMFAYCYNLTNLDLSNFNTSKVTSMSIMFFGCTSLRTIYVGNDWSTAAVTGSYDMFYNCTSLVGGKGTTYNSSNPRDKTYAHIDGGPSNPGYFTRDPNAPEPYACYTPSNTTLTFYYDKLRSNRSGTTYDLNEDNNWPGWMSDGTAASVTRVVFYSSFADARPRSTQGWLADMTNLQSVLGIQYLNTSEVTNMFFMFAYCGLPSINLSYLNTSNVTSMEAMFLNSSFTSLDVSSFNTSNVVDMHEMFAYCYNLTSLDLSNFNTSKVTNLEGMFNESINLESINMSNWNTSNVTDMSYMFNECNALTSVDLSSFNTAKVTTMYSMFDYCTSLTSLDLSSFNTSKVTDMRWMFSSCSELTTIYAGNGWSTAATTDSNSDGMFRECTKIRGGQGTTYNASHTNRLYARIDGGPSNPGYFTDKNAGLRGDVNGDGSVNIDDVTALIDYLLGSNSSINVANADADQSGGVSIDDVTALIDYLLTGRWS